MNLVIVESPKKAKDIGKMLGDGWRVVATRGHFCDLPEKELGVAPPDFRPTYVVDSEKKDTLKQLVKLSKEAHQIYLATDPDREGEAIAWHLQRELKIKDAQRVSYQEVTKEAVTAALKQPRKINMRLVAAQEARRILDRLAGYKVSGRVSDFVGQKKLSAGRVQSPALRLIVVRERAIRNFVKREHWSIKLATHKDSTAFTAVLKQWQGVELEQFSFPNAASHAPVLSALQDLPAQVTKIDKKERLRKPQAPFTTSTYQQEGARKLRMSTDTLMKIAQTLYEGKELPEGAVGLITYMRTDATALSAEALSSIREHILATHGQAYLPDQPVIYKTKTKNAQEAHEAIRPTSIARTPELMKPYLSDEEFRVYQMIWQRTVACQMQPARFDATAVDITIGDGLFRANGAVQTFPGYLAVYQDGKEDEDKDDDGALPPLAVNESLPVDKLYGEQHFTQPPTRYSQSTLVMDLEKYSIGRPSTYVSIISTLIHRDYVRIEKGKFVPTALGEKVFDFLDTRFAFSTLEFTGSMEDDLDRVANGEMNYVTLITRFHDALEAELAQLPPPAPRFEVTEHACPSCGKPLRKMSGKFGSFFSCSDYPQCTTALDDVDGVPTPRKPRAESVERTKHQVGDSCPTCKKGALIKRDAREGNKHFLGCNQFPACKFMEWL